MSSSSPMKARPPYSSVVMDETVPLLKIRDLNLNVERFRLLARVSMLGPIMKNDTGKEAAILHFRLIDSTGEILASVHHYMAAEWKKNLTLDKTFMFLGRKDPKYPTFAVLKMDESTGQPCIHFNFLSKVKPMYNVLMPDIEYSDLIQVTSSEPNPAIGFNFVVEIVDCLPANGPNKEYDVMQQQFKIQDHSQADIDVVVKGNELVPRMKTFKPKQSERMIVRIFYGKLEKLNCDPEVDIGESEITIVVDQKNADIEILSLSSPLRINFLAKYADAVKKAHVNKEVAANAVKRGLGSEEVAAAGSGLEKKSKLT